MRSNEPFFSVKKKKRGRVLRDYQVCKHNYDLRLLFRSDINFYIYPDLLGPPAHDKVSFLCAGPRQRESERVALLLPSTERAGLLCCFPRKPGNFCCFLRCAFSFVPAVIWILFPRSRFWIWNVTGLKDGGTFGTTLLVNLFVKYYSLKSVTFFLGWDPLLTQFP